MLVSREGAAQILLLGLRSNPWESFRCGCRLDRLSADASGAGVEEPWAAGPPPGLIDPSLRRGVCSSQMPQRHLEAAQTHDEAARRYQEAALYWEEHGDREHAALERRNMEIELAAAQLERRRADFIQRKRRRHKRRLSPQS